MERDFDLTVEPQARTGANPAAQTMGPTDFEVSVQAKDTLRGIVLRTPDGFAIARSDWYRVTSGIVVRPHDGAAPSTFPALRASQPPDDYQPTVQPAVESQDDQQDSQKLQDNTPTVFVPDAALVAAVSALADAHPNPDAAARLRRIVAGMTGEAGGYTAAECRGTAAGYGVTGAWQPWCDEIERRERWP